MRVVFGEHIKVLSVLKLLEKFSLWPLLTYMIFLPRVDWKCRRKRSSIPPSSLVLSSLVSILLASLLSLCSHLRRYWIPMLVGIICYLLSFIILEQQRSCTLLFQQIRKTGSETCYQRNRSVTPPGVPTSPPFVPKVNSPVVWYVPQAGRCGGMFPKLFVLEPFKLFL